TIEYKISTLLDQVLDGKLWNKRPFVINNPQKKDVDWIKKCIKTVIEHPLDLISKLSNSKSDNIAQFSHKFCARLLFTMFAGSRGYYMLPGDENLNFISLYAFSSMTNLAKNINIQYIDFYNS